MDRESVQERFGIIGTSSAIRHVIDQVRLVARTDANVLIQGESGVGKELVAQAIQELGSRRHQGMTIVNCGAIPEGLIESELFGTEKGAFTGAVEKRAGYFEAADQGTIFLDEIGEMPASAQVRLLRVLESGEYSRIGSTKTRISDARIIAATNKNLEQEVRLGKFREDLYYRLTTVIINIPPLRDRRSDILPIFEKFVHEISQKYKASSKKLTSAAQDLLQKYRWPGNIRELRNVAERSVVMVLGNELDVDHLRPFLRGVSADGSQTGLVPVSTSAGDQGGHGERELQLVYRALVELRLEMRELKQYIRQLSEGTAYPVEGGGIEPSREMVVYDDSAGKRGEKIIEDVTYQLEVDDGHGDFEPDEITTETNGSSDDLPTLEAAERELINEALERYNGNRRQSARALGISERTLYRKIKEMEAEDEAS